jgi:Chagasin family peptidase inhibitor I42
MRPLRLVTVLLVLAVTACGSDPVVTVGYDKGSVSVPVGGRIRVDLGTVSESIGDGWFLIGAPDAKLLKDDGAQYGPGCGAGMAGCSHSMYWQFTALAKGSTTVRFRYCYRSRPERCDTGPGRGPAQPVLILVTVS